jgi:hypothetical protein
MEREQLRQIVAQAVGRAQSDKGFQTRLTADPVPVIESTYGVRLPESFDPARLRARIGERFGVHADGGALDDEQLDAVAGGSCICVSPI